MPTSPRNVGPGRYTWRLHYRDGPREPYTNVSILQGSALADISASCSQNIQYRCQSSVLLNTPNEPYGWWVSRNDMKMVSWGGAPVDSRKCACGVTNSCSNVTKMCNCDANQSNMLDDSGSITDKRYLPIKEMRFGYESYDPNRIGLFLVGKLSCRGRCTRIIKSRYYLNIYIDSILFVDVNASTTLKIATVNFVIFLFNSYSFPYHHIYDK